MIIPFRTLFFALCSSTLSLTACSDSSDDSPAPTTALVKFQDATGSFTPATALTKITATPVGGGTVYVATQTIAGTYRLQGLPLGTYDLAFEPTSGYATPTRQRLTIQASSATAVPEITVLTERTAMLTGGTWTVTSNVTQNATTSTSVDNLAMDPACARDNFLRFTADKVLWVDEGLVKCDAANPQVFTYGWAFEKNETQLRFINPDGSSTVGDIVQLTASLVQLRDSRTSGGQVYVQTITYTAR